MASWVNPRIAGIPDWYVPTAQTRLVILSRSAAQAPALSKVEGKNLAVCSELRDSSLRSFDTVLALPFENLKVSWLRSSR